METIGERYDIISEIGQGGMGAIFKARDNRTQQVVAIKLLKPEVVQNDPDMLQRFAREGEALRKLNHPNIVKMWDTIEENGNHYIVMDYVEGGSLRDLLRKTPQLSIEHVLNIALDLSDALIRAHRLKIIHRDIKPENVLMNADGTPLLTDFGVARMSGNSDSVTQTGVIIGTLAYLPPETLQASRIDERGDMWAFGVMLYEMLTGRRPFDGDSTATLLHNILMTPTPDIFTFRSDVPYSVMGLIYWMLEKERDKRPASMRLVGAMLENILSGEQLPLNWFSEKGVLPNETPTPEQITNAVREYTSNALKLTDFPTVGASTPTPTPSEIDAKTVTPAIMANTPPIPTTSQTPKNRVSAPVALAVGIAAGFLVLILLFMAINSSAPQPSEIMIAPVGADETMVLIAEFVRVAGEERDANRLIVDDLRQTFEGLTVSRTVIREYPSTIQNDAEAIAIADTYDALIVIWGTYDTDGADISVQLGDYSRYGELLFTREEMSELTNTRVRVTNSGRETLTYSVVQTDNIINSYSGNILTITRNLALIQDVTAPPALIQGRGINTSFYNYLVNYAFAIDDGIASLNSGIQQDPTNAMLFQGRSLAYQRAGDVDRALEDNRTAQRLAPEGWITPLYNLLNIQIYFLNDMPEGLKTANQLVVLRPDDWFVWFNRGVIYYSLQQYTEAGDDSAQAILLGADENYPYLLSVAVALRHGELVLARQGLNEVLRLFPDPFVAQRILSSTLNQKASQFFVVPLSLAFGNVVLGQWSEVIITTDEAIANDQKFSDLYLMRGLAQCNLGQDANAEVSYSTAIEIDPDYYLMYLLRAEVRRNQGNLIGATSDLGIVLQSPQRAIFEPLMSDATSGALGCKTFLTYEPPSETTAEATP